MPSARKLQHFPVVPPRPLPPPDLLEDDAPADFRPAPDVALWLLETMVLPGAPFHSETHQHLEEAMLGVLWTNVPNALHQRRLFATAEIPQPPSGAGKWTRARWECDLRARFAGERPDFLITFDAGLAAEASDLTWCRVCRHELLHCGQALDAFGDPRFDGKTGRALYAIRGHDVEEFVEVVEDFGAGEDVERLVQAGRRAPRFGGEVAAWSCGTCLRRAA